MNFFAGAFIDGLLPKRPGGVNAIALANTRKYRYYSSVRSPAIIACLCAALLLSGCSKLFWPFGGGDDDSKSPSTFPDRVIDPTTKFSLAVGGVAPGRDELVITESNGDPRDFSGKTLECRADDDIVQIRLRPGFDSQTAGSGVQLVAVDAGVTAIRCAVDGVDLSEVYEVTIPPQHLIQILLAEGGGQIRDEAETEERSGTTSVKLESESPTADALGSVIRNRINLINSADTPGLFEADADAYGEDPPASFYDAVILADGQFAPTDEDDPSHDNFENAQDRNFLEGDWQIAYDQALLSAAGIFNGDAADNTGGSFAFRTPTASEWSVIQSAWTTFSFVIPDGAGFSDADFPALAPIQVLIHPDLWKDTTQAPAFVFARQRTMNDYAVSNSP